MTSNINNFDTADRAGLIHDAFQLASIGKMTYSSALDLLKYVENEKEYVPWRSAAEILEHLQNMLESGPNFGKWRVFVKQLTHGIFDNLGFEDADSTHLSQYLRSYVRSLACNHGNTKCLDNCTKSFMKWLNGQALEPGVQNIVFKYGMRKYGNEANWNYMWEKYRNSVVPQEQKRLLYGLSQTNEPWLIQRLLAYSMDGTKVRSQDFFSLMAYISYNPVGLEVIWDWARANWQQLVDRFSLSNRYLGRMVPSMIINFNTEFQLQEVEAFFAKYPDAGAGVMARKQAVDRIKSNIAWMKANEQQVSSWLDANGYV